MSSWFLYVAFLAILLSCISSLKAFRLDMPVIFKHFSFFLFFVFLGEIFALLWVKKLYQFTPFTRNSHWFYNIFHFVIYLFYLYFFHAVLLLPKVKKWIRLLAVAYAGVAIINFFFVQGPFRLNTYTELLACFIMVFLSIAYYYQLLYAKEIISLRRDTVFWLSTGILIYHLGSMMGLFFINIMNIISVEKAKSVHLIIQVASVLMSINFSIAFLCRKKK